MVKSWETRPDLANSTPWQPQEQHGLLQWQRSEKRRPGTGFLDLPRELRNMVYRYHFGNSRVMCCIYDDFWHRRVPPSGLSIRHASERESLRREYWRDYCQNLPKETTETQFLLLCKQIHYEASEMMYKNTTLALHFEDDVLDGRIIVRPTRVDGQNLPATYLSFIRRISFENNMGPFIIEWNHQPCFVALSERLISTFSLFTHVDVIQEFDWDLFNNAITSWRILWDEKHEGDNHELRSKLLNTTVNQLFPKRPPALPFMHLAKNHHLWGYWLQYDTTLKEQEKEFSEAFERMKREFNVECSNRGNHVQCDDGSVLSLGYRKSIDGGYVDHYDGWGPDMKEWVDGFEEFDEFDGWAWSLEEYWDVWKDKQARKAITSPALLRKY